MHIRKLTTPMILSILTLIACQTQTPTPVVSTTSTDQPMSMPSTTAPTSTSIPEATSTPTLAPEATLTLSADEPGSVQFESLKMFDESGTGDIANTGGWAVALLPDGYEYILHTEDGGQIWNHATQTMGINSGLYFFLSAQNAWNVDPNTEQLQRTLDGGQTWQNVFNYSDDPTFYEALSFNFWDADHGISISGLPAAGTSLLKLNDTRDGGGTWERLTITAPWEGAVSELGELVLCNLCSDQIHINASRIAIVYGLNADRTLQSEIGFAISPDEGKTWRDGKALMPAALINHLAKFGAITFFDDQQGVFSLWSSEKESPQDFTEYSTLFPFYTSDGGITWTPGTPTPTADIQYIFVNYEQFLSPADAILRCGNGFCVTHDGARSWTSIQPDIEFPQSTDAAEWLDDLDFINPNLGFAVFSSSGVSRLYHTRDGGTHWTQVDYQLTE